MAKKINEDELKNVSGGACGEPQYSYYAAGLDKEEYEVRVEETARVHNLEDAKSERDSIVANIFAKYPNVVKVVTAGRRKTSIIDGTKEVFTR